MKLADVMRAIEFLLNAGCFVVVVILAVLLIKRAISFSKYAKEYNAFYERTRCRTVFGKVVYKERFRGSLLVRNIFKVTVKYRVEDKFYEFTELTIDKVCVTDGSIEVDYDIDDPSNARIKDDTAASDYLSAAGKSIAEIIFLIMLLFFLSMVVPGILVWVDYIIRFVYELAGGIPENL